MNNTICTDDTEHTAIDQRIALKRHSSDSVPLTIECSGERGLLCPDGRPWIVADGEVIGQDCVETWLSVGGICTVYGFSKPEQLLDGADLIGGFRRASAIW